MDCVLFDLDGTVADTEVLKAKGLALAVQAFGGHVSPEVYKAVMGQSWECVTRAFFHSAGIEIPLNDFNPVFRERYSQLIDNELVESRSILHFLRFLKSQKMRLGLVSSASPWMIQKVVGKLGLNESFDMIISNADTEKHKPHPEAYLLALAKLSVNPEATIAFEDSESGFVAATTAGLNVYGIRHAYNDRHDFSLCKGVISNFDECLSWKMLSKAPITPPAE
jgi:HAD superfamily hydrolase (TIGR01509 family)